MNTTSASPLHVSSTIARSGQRALVLGGGGSTGNAWLIGVIAGLYDAGLDVTTADLTVGTSAGATAAAQLAGAPPGELYEATLVAPPQRQNRPSRSGPGRDPGTSVADHLDRIRTIIAASEDAADMRRRMGSSALAMAADSDGSWQTMWRATVASRLPSQDWPERSVLITAVDARTGDPAAFDRHSGVDLADAVAASCSSGQPFMIGDNAYIDGGYRSNAENADLATGHERVLVLAPLGGRSLVPERWGTHLSAQVEALRSSGSRVETVFPEDDAGHLFGANAMDVSLRPPAARAGHDQGRALAQRLSELWR
ncbi:patatin-like phospholipase family protein [Aeromicrobium ginsengisoli]|uniref:Patatin-like phospholipase family protein n=1 Tax=Aeromicrobium ginsengisoli TaxID=363867 RepID=A0A5M4FIX9_9ACTN|nr:patatin-like phospholipase family protein [Aeromicrobium ginsengisoli]KAA1400097.1 patatin-like phospholipase family protein [Aeromicrobium ginsengisoli]